MVALNYEEIKWNRERISNIKQFINKYKWKGIKHPSKIGDWKTFGKKIIIWQLLLIFCKLKKKEYVQLISQKLIRIVEKNNSTDDFKRRKRRLALFYGKETI